jgi:hypothetical protein
VVRGARTAVKPLANAAWIIEDIILLVYNQPDLIRREGEDINTGAEAVSAVAQHNEWARNMVKFFQTNATTPQNLFVCCNRIITQGYIATYAVLRSGVSSGMNESTRGRGVRMHR